MSWAPSQSFDRDPWFYFKYDAAWAVALSALTAWLIAIGWDGISISILHAAAVLPLGAYLLVLAHVVVHNASHQNLPRWINTIAGELLGALVATRFASWEILHRRHHQYFGDPAKDPHPAEASFVRFLVKSMLLNLEKNLHQQYYERFGDTPATRTRERLRSMLSFATMLVLMAFWYVLLGPTLFTVVYLPASIFGLLVVAHFNWVTHDQQSAPLNLDHGVYRVLNLALFGMYLHENHHRDPSWFNPARARLR